MMDKLTTERRNPKTLHIDMMSTVDILKIINQEDISVPKVISQPDTLRKIAQVVDGVYNSLKNGGRLFYIGAGTSGRLGVLDAAECVPTYGTDPEMVQGLIAGGERAMLKAVEGAEDSVTLARKDLEQHEVTVNDFVIGIAASGGTPYVIGGLDYARKLGVPTAAISCNHDAMISSHANTAIEVVVGPEVVTGSTRMKAGTAQKLVLNMISTSVMIKLGKVYGNLMVDVMPTNAKLVSRAKRIIQEATDCDLAVAEKYYELANHNPKLAIVMINADVDREQAQIALDDSDGRISAALAILRQRYAQ